MECGNSITTIHGIQGIIVAVINRFGSITYEMMYIIDSTPVTMIVTDGEIIKSKNKRKIGFNNNNNNNEL